MIDTTMSNAVTTIPVGGAPAGVAVTPDGSKVYVTSGAFNVAVIDTTTSAVTQIPVSPIGGFPTGVAVTSDGRKVYVTNQFDASVAVIDTATDMVTTIQNIASGPTGVAVTPDGGTVYVTDIFDNTVAVIATASNAVTTRIPFGSSVPFGVGVTPDGSKVYVADEVGNNVAVIATINNTVTTTIPVNPAGWGPVAFGIFIQPKPRFAGNPTNLNCYGVSINALQAQFGSLGAAAMNLGFASVCLMENAIITFATRRAR